MTEDVQSRGRRWGRGFFMFAAARGGGESGMLARSLRYVAAGSTGLVLAYSFLMCYLLVRVRPVPIMHLPRSEAVRTSTHEGSTVAPRSVLGDTS